MISPSKVQHQQRKQPTRDNSDSHSHVRLQKGRKPLERKSFYLDIKNHALATNLEAKIKDLGGITELFLIKSVTLVVSDRADKLGQNNCDKRKWVSGSGGSGGPPSLRSVEVPTPIATPPTPFGGEYPLSNSTNIRGQTVQRSKSRADAMLERALTQPQQCSVDPLNNAQNWGIPIWATKKLQAWLDKIYESLKDTGNLKYPADQSNTEKSLKVKQLKNSYIKFESFKRDTRPVFLELPLWPKLNFDGDSGTCPFDTRIREKKVCKEESPSLNKEKGKEMTRRPRATATRARRTEQLVAGYCEMCRIDYRDLSKHVQSDKHMAFVRNDDNFLSLDKLINSGASVEAFLRANEVGQDCSLFPDGDQSIYNVDLEDDKVKKGSKTDLSTFGMDEINIVQCNGARRNLDLKLSSPHNLRTRAKHESGHLLRSKGSPWDTLQEKSDKYYDKFEGFTIKKRAKGTIWIEEDENTVKKCSRLEDDREIDPDDVDKPLLPEERTFTTKSKDLRELIDRKSDSLDDRVLPKLERNDLAISSDIENDSSRITNIPRLEKETRSNEDLPKVEKITLNGQAAFIVNAEDASDECKNGFNGFERIKAPESFPESQLPGNSAEAIGKKSPVRESSVTRDGDKIFNGAEDNNATEDREIIEKEEKPKVSGRIGKRIGRGFRGRPRLSVEERLIEDNRAYYKVEVLGNKLRSSTGPWSASATGNTTGKASKVTSVDENSCAPPEETMKKEQDDEVSSEKPVVVRFKRVRRSELSLLSDEAESFMFGEPKREDETSSEASEDDASSVMPRETETSEIYDTNNLNIDNEKSVVHNSVSTINSSSPVKQEPITIVDDETTQDSCYSGRARKRRRTQAEMLLEDNEEYYTFETPGSRLRFQGMTMMGGNEVKEHPEHAKKTLQRQSTEIRETQQQQQSQNNEIKTPIIVVKTKDSIVEKLYPSKPSPEVEKMQFSFEAVPKSEPWYQTYQRQDEGAEFWHYFSESDERKPFLLPYEIDNFHETLAKIFLKNDGIKKNRRGGNGMGKSPRKSPRCHASTLAIMSTIIRKREQQLQPTNLSVVEEEPRCSSRELDITTKSETKAMQQTQEESKCDTDGELRDIAKSIDDMLSADGIIDPDDSFENGLAQQANIDEAPSIPRGPPPDLLDLLDNCHGYLNCFENSSCASSDCGEGAIESPLKRRKRRKNRTGWPGIKMRKKLQAKQIVDAYAAKKNEENDKIDTDMVDDRLRDNQVNCKTRKDYCETADDSRASGEASDKGVISDGDVKRDSDKFVNVRQRQVKRESEDFSSPVQCEAITGSEETDDVYPRQRNIVKNTEISENSNDENHENASTRVIHSKSMTRKRVKNHDTSSEAIDSRNEIENNDNLYIKNKNSSIIARKNYTNNSLTGKKRQRESASTAESQESSEHSVVVSEQRHERCQKDATAAAAAAAAAVLTRKQMRTRKRQRRGTLRSDLEYEDENFKNLTIIKNAKGTSCGARRRNNETVVSESLDSDLDCLAERVSPSLMPTTELQNRRSSIEFQPVVRMMKIEDQVDMDHSILSVTVASNRRLRSSSSPRSKVRPPTKRYKRSKGPFGRWIKNS